jgi:DNA modification methylase
LTEKIDGTDGRSNRWRSRIVRSENMDPRALAANPANWRTHPELQSKALVGVLDEIGWVDRVLWNQQTNHMIDGHLRVKQAVAHGEISIPVDVVDLTQEEEDVVLATFDPLTALAETDAGKLRELLDRAHSENPATQELLDRLRAGIKTPSARDEEADAPAPAPPVVPCSQRGDIWLLGKHRLMCGDSTDAGDVTLMMGGERAGLMNTDPPYGVSYDNSDRPNPGVAKPRVAKPRVAKDDLRDAKLQDFLEAAFRAAKDNALKSNAAWYLWHAHLTQGFFAAAAAAAAAAVILHRQIIWVKPVLLLGRGHYHWKHEPCFMGWIKGHEPPDYGLGNGERTQTTVWEIGSVTQSDRREFNHATPKPVGLFTIPIAKHLKVGDICYEPFAGSGPQIIAAELLDRRCFALEIDPSYCDVVIKRWQNFSDRQATLDVCGSTFEQVRAERLGAIGAAAERAVEPEPVVQPPKRPAHGR